MDRVVGCGNCHAGWRLRRPYTDDYPISCYLISTPIPATATPVPSPTSMPEQEEIESADNELPQPEGEPVRVAESDVQRVTSPGVDQTTIAQLVEGNRAFAFDLYQMIKDEKDNLFYSPYSISLALAMAYAGAEGETQQQMADALPYTVPEDRLHAAFNAVDQKLTSCGEDTSDEEGGGLELNIANAMWGQRGLSFRPEYLDILARNYGAGLRLLDFFRSPEESRKAINDWVSDETRGKIEDLLPPGSVSEYTRLTLTNAIYFKAAWSSPFKEKDTHDSPFHLLDGSQVMAPMMKQTRHFGYTEGEIYQAVELPYEGAAKSMVILLPRAGRFEGFESTLTAEQVGTISSELESKNITLTMPKFEFDASFGLAETLAQMGMPDAFLPELADFSGTYGGPGNPKLESDKLYIDDVVHKAFVSVDEEETEAAAATGVMFGITSVPEPPVEVTVDRPFIFLIRDIETGAILFVGRLRNPA